MLASLQMRSWTIALFVMLPSALFGQSQGVQPIKTSSSATSRRDLTVKQAHALVKAFQRDHGEDGYGLDQYEVKDYPGFQFFQAVPDPPSGRIHYPVDLRTGEVWDEGPCEKLTSPSLKKLQSAIRKRIGLTADEYRKIGRPCPFCEK